MRVHDVRIEYARFVHDIALFYPRGVDDEIRRGHRLGVYFASGDSGGVLDVELLRIRVEGRDQLIIGDGFRGGENPRSGDGRSMHGARSAKFAQDHITAMAASSVTVRNSVS